MHETLPCLQNLTHRSSWCCHHVYPCACWRAPLDPVQPCVEHRRRCASTRPCGLPAHHRSVALPDMDTVLLVQPRQAVGPCNVLFTSLFQLPSRIIASIVPCGMYLVSCSRCTCNALCTCRRSQSSLSVSVSISQWLFQLSCAGGCRCILCARARHAGCCKCSVTFVVFVVAPLAWCCRTQVLPPAAAGFDGALDS